MVEVVRFPAPSLDDPWPVPAAAVKTPFALYVYRTTTFWFDVERSLFVVLVVVSDASNLAWPLMMPNDCFMVPEDVLPNGSTDENVPSPKVVRR